MSLVTEKGMISYRELETIFMSARLVTKGTLTTLWIDLKAMVLSGQLRLENVNGVAWYRLDYEIIHCMSRKDIDRYDQVLRMRLHSRDHNLDFSKVSHSHSAVVKSKKRKRETACKCGETTHKRVTHRYCPFNKGLSQNYLL
mgnify:CR=1 FL=1